MNPFLISFQIDVFHWTGSWSFHAQTSFRTLVETSVHVWTGIWICLYHNIWSRKTIFWLFLGWLTLEFHFWIENNFDFIVCYLFLDHSKRCGLNFHAEGYNFDNGLFKISDFICFFTLVLLLVIPEIQMKLILIDIFSVNSKILQIKALENICFPCFSKTSLDIKAN